MTNHVPSPNPLGLLYTTHLASNPLQEGVPEDRGESGVGYPAT
ncbi:MAG: hypothetical protein SFW36_00255 [Leptolyngbyaceae cyanobacterium bins.59]|nr:hypothetical protein [Leptolyngbyaceae cyanobacterium bins.59]